MTSVRPLLLAVVGFSLGGCFPPAAPPASPIPAFRDVAQQAGIRYAANSAASRPRDILEANGSGCAFLDYDGDGWYDVLLAGRPRCALFRNQNGRFIETTAQAGLGRSGHWIGIGVADWDNDGDADLCVVGYRCGALYRNDGGRFTEVAGASGIRFPSWGQSPAFGDVDGDGRLDLFVSAYAEFGPQSPRICRRGTVPAVCGPELYKPELGRLYRNLGGGRFRDVTRQAGLVDAHGRSWGAMFQDFDGDGRTDLYVANDMIACDLFRNLGRGRFRNIGLPSSTAYDGDGDRIGGMAVDWADYDGDQRPDLLVTAFSAQSTVLFRQVSLGQFEDDSDASGISTATTPLVGFGGKFLDFDNDGWRDLLLVNGHLMDNIEALSASETYRQPLLLLRNEAGRFADESAARLGDLPRIAGRGAAFGDWNNDGRPDALVMDLEGPPLLLRNESAGGHWLGLRLVGVTSNRDGIGAVVRVSAGGRQQRFECQTSGSLLSSNDPRILVGLGTALEADSVEVAWPSGAVTRLSRLPHGAYLTIREPPKRSGRAAAPAPICIPAS